MSLVILIQANGGGVGVGVGVGLGVGVGVAQTQVVLATHAAFRHFPVEQIKPVGQLALVVHVVPHFAIGVGVGVTLGVGGGVDVPPQEAPQFWDLTPQY